MVCSPTLPPSPSLCRHHGLAGALLALSGAPRGLHTRRWVDAVAGRVLLNLRPMTTTLAQTWNMMLLLLTARRMPGESELLLSTPLAVPVLAS